MTDQEIDREGYWKSAFDRMAARNHRLSDALKPFADLGVSSGPDHQADKYNIEIAAIRNARAALTEY